MYNENHMRIIRILHNLEGSGGNMYLANDTDIFCHTQEDVPRGINIKIPKYTGLPAGEYFWKVTHSPRFKRDMVLIYTEPGDYSVYIFGIRFTGVRLHGGNDADDSEGCPLVAFNRKDKNSIYGSAEKELTDWAKSVGGEGTLTITNN